MSNVIDLGGTDEGLATVQMGGASITIDVVATHAKLTAVAVEFDGRPDADYWAAIVAEMERQGIPRPTAFQASRYVQLVREAAEALVKKYAPATATTPA